MSPRFLSLAIVFLLVLQAAMSPVSAQHSDTKGKVALLISFGAVDDPDALALSRSFALAAKSGEHPFDYGEAIVSSPFEAAEATREFMQEDKILLVVIAGDEGSTVAAALLSAELKVPLLKLSSDEHSFVGLSEQLYEFLPSCEAQGEFLAEFAVRDQQATRATVLCPESGRTQATTRGFCSGMKKEAAIDPAMHYYSPASASIKTQLAELRDDFTWFQEADTEAALASDGTSNEHAAFFFALPRDRIETYAAQMSRYPGNVRLYGNAGWLHRDALNRQNRITTDMYIVAPLLPEAEGESTVLDSLLASSESDPSEWELLGIDAGGFVAGLFAANPSSRREVAKAIQSTETYRGIAARVDFRDGQENHNARILQYDGHNLIVIR